MAKMTEKDLLKRDAKRNIGNELLQAVQEMKAGKVGHVHRVAMSAVTAARTSAGISQSEFATLLGVSPRTRCCANASGYCSQASAGTPRNLRYLNESPAPLDLPAIIRPAWRSFTGLDVTFELDACDVGSSTILLRLYGPGADALVEKGATHSENAGRFPHFESKQGRRWH
jgi:hypothetical protein